MLDVGRIVQDIYHDFQKMATKKPSMPLEVNLFRMLENAIKRYGGDAVIIDEVHAKSRVEFKSTISNQTERCEISDWLLIVVSRQNMSFRATFWQAKRHLKSNFFTTFRFRSPRKQWELLALRPKIRGIGRFRPPEDLLQAAPSPAIGSFGVFYQTPFATIELAFSVAEALTVISPLLLQPQDITLQINTNLRGRFAYRTQDVLVETDLRCFLVSLLSSKIGALYRVGEGENLALFTWKAAQKIVNGANASDLVSYIDFLNKMVSKTPFAKSSSWLVWDILWTAFQEQILVNENRHRIQERLREFLDWIKVKKTLYWIYFYTWSKIGRPLLDISPVHSDFHGGGGGVDNVLWGEEGGDDIHMFVVWVD